MNESDETSSTGEVLRAIRGKTTQQEFARLLGIGRNTLVRYESGERDPDAVFLRRLHSTFGVDPLEVLTGKKPELPELSAEEARLLKLYRAADAKGRSAIDQVAELAGKQTTKSEVAQSNTGKRAIQIGSAGGKVEIKTR